MNFIKSTFFVGIFTISFLVASENAKIINDAAQTTNKPVLLKGAPTGTAEQVKAEFARRWASAQKYLEMYSAAYRAKTNGVVH